MEGIKNFKGLETIQSAALKINGEIFTGNSHAEALEKFQEKYPEKQLENLIDGFVTSTDRFVTRNEAAEIANTSKQLDIQKGYLDSEDLGDPA